MYLSPGERLQDAPRVDFTGWSRFEHHAGVTIGEPRERRGLTGCERVQSPQRADLVTPRVVSRDNRGPHQSWQADRRELRLAMLAQLGRERAAVGAARRDGGGAQ